MTMLKQSTAATVQVGPFVDDGDGVTPETGLTISQADIRLSKVGAAFAQTHNAAGATHDENGWYRVPLDTTDTNTIGKLTVAVYESGALPVWVEFEVVPANIYDSLVAGTDYLQGDAVQISGDGTAADNLESYCDGNANIPADTVKISGDSTAANNLELYCDGGDRMPVDVEEYGAALDFNATQKASIGAAASAWTVEGALDVAEVLKLILAFCAGTTAGAETDTLIYYSQDGLTARITMTVDEYGERTVVVVDAS